MSKTLRYLPTLLVLILGLNLTTSCFDDTEYNIAEYNNLIISNVSFGTLPRVLHTTSKSGKDSLVYSTVSATSVYPFTIDQINNHIFNVDSLPYGTRADKIIFSDFAVADGQAAIIVPGTERDTIYAKTDTLDFSQGYRDFRLYGADLASLRTYRVEVRIHQQTTDSLTWTQHSTDDFAAHKPQQNNNGKEYSAAGYTFRLDEGSIMISNDGNDFTPDAIDDDDDKDCLPADNCSWAWRTSAADEAIKEVFLYGTRGDNDALKAHFWRRNIDTKGQLHYSWEHLPSTINNTNPLPNLHHATLSNYDKGLLLVGLNADGTIIIRHSSDYGRTWKKHSALILKTPLDKLKATTLEAYVDSDNNLWMLIDGKDVWRGRAHKVSWNEEQNKFTK